MCYFVAIILEPVKTRGAECAHVGGKCTKGSPPAVHHNQPSQKVQLLG